MLSAIDYKTGKVRWTRNWGSVGMNNSGWLSTAGKVLIGGDPNGNFVALDAVTGSPLWHTRLGATVTNGPMTYELDGLQYVVVGAGDSLFAFNVLP